MARRRTGSSTEGPADLVIGGRAVRPGERLRVDLPVARLPTHTWLHLPLTVLRGRRDGPRVWLSAAVHGDELNGVEIIRRVLGKLEQQELSGTVLAVPVVNVMGFIQQSRYLPDRRDLNRCFPGSARGSLASRLAYLLMKEVVEHSTHGIDLHTATAERSNLPQVRANLDDPETRRCATAFGTRVLVHSAVRDGSLRGAATRRGIPVIVYEGGEAQRFNDEAIEIGVQGTLRVLQELGVVRRRSRRVLPAPQVVRHTSWVRARQGGLLRLAAAEGDEVAAGQRLGVIADPFGEDPMEVRAPTPGIVIGRTCNPVVHKGDALVNLGSLEEPRA